MIIISIMVCFCCWWWHSFRNDCVLRRTLWQDNRDTGQEKMWPLKHRGGGGGGGERGKCVKLIMAMMILVIQCSTRVFLLLRWQNLSLVMISFGCRLCPWQCNVAGRPYSCSILGGPHVKRLHLNCGGIIDCIKIGEIASPGYECHKFMTTLCLCYKI